MLFFSDQKPLVDAQLLGAKAAALALLEQQGFAIPAWFTLSPAWLAAHLTTSSPEPGESSLITSQPPVGVTPAGLAALEQALDRLCPDGCTLAVRSSACEEDSATHSFAGQFDSFLHVSKADVAARVVDVWRSAFGPRVRAYRRAHNIDAEPTPPAVLIQRMVSAHTSGVAFSTDPLAAAPEAIVAALYGFGSALVNGEVEPDTYRVAEDGSIRGRCIADKQTQHQAHASGSGVKCQAVMPELACRPALTDTQVALVAQLARAVETCCGCPQDIEWAFADGQLYLLQARPITTNGAAARRNAGGFNLWDNSNIAESYSGVTTPLTFSFARRAYEEVYRQLCHILGVPESVIVANHAIFRTMLGLRQGRIYYNLLSWYRTLALLPGFAANQRFMEQMMGVRETLPPELRSEFATPSWRRRVWGNWQLARMIGGLAVSYLTLPQRTRRFRERLEEALAYAGSDLDRQEPAVLAATYRALEQRLLTRWDAPLVNDFFAMVWYGLLRQLAQRWCGEGSDLHNALIGGEGQIISAEPALRMHTLARAAAEHPELVAVLQAGTLGQIERQLTTAPIFARLYQEYLERFGERCLDELKLESLTLHDDPLPLLRQVGLLAAHGVSSDTYSAYPLAAQRSAVRAAAEARVAQLLARRPLRRLVFGLVLRQARGRVRDRENLRFERTRLFGRARRIFVELGRHYHRFGLLDDARDIFYLEVEEALGFVEGTTTCVDLRGLAALRRREFAAYAAASPPPDRFQTHGPVHLSRELNQPDATRRSAEAAPDTLRGLGCCAGVVRGRVRVIRNPQQALIEPGEILVAERTDPGWIMLFPAAAGLLVERGSLLSHAAIVARELGLPAIVSLVGATTRLRDGDLVEMDGATGLVRLLSDTTLVLPEASEQMVMECHEL